MINRHLILPFVVIGDILILLFALLTSLFVRHMALPQAAFFGAHSEPLILVLISSLVVFFVSGLYDVFSITHARTLIRKIAIAQSANTIFAILFFYFITIWGITPKTTLVLYVGISTIFLFIWRLQIVPLFIGSLPKEEAVIVAELDEGKELFGAISHETPYPLFAVDALFLNKDTDITHAISFLEATTKSEFKKRTLIVDTRSELADRLSNFLYEYIGDGGEVRSFTDVYEEVFGKIPESSLRAENIIDYMYSKHKGYELLKRIMDIFIALPLFIITIWVYPFVWVGNKIQDGGPLFFTHDRMGRGGKKIKLYKFRSMTFGDTSATWVKTEGNANKVTKFGYFIRKTRIDELPQLLNVLRGDMSLVGPRPDIWSLGVKSQEEIPFYKARLAVPPGLSGWAQVSMHTPPQNMEETKERLLHDIYYVKNRSFVLDILIALKTIKTLLSREGM